MSDEQKRAVAYLNDKEEAAIWSIPPELLPDLIERDPARAKKLVESTADVAEIAAKLKQWEAMHQAVRFLIACEQAVLDWWGNNVAQHGGARSLDRGISVTQAERTIGFSDSLISRWRGSLKDPNKYASQLVEHARRKAGLEPEENHRAEGTGENEWFTPEQYIEAARKVMGEIDLDPATHPAAQETIQATEFFTREDDALSREWHGRVWLNPPYAQPLIGQFVGKLVEEIEAGRVKQAILLTHNYTDTAWFHAAQAGAPLICFTRGRIKFVDLNGENCAPTQGQAFFYYGPRVDRFWREFTPFGFVLGHARN